MRIPAHKAALEKLISNDEEWILELNSDDKSNYEELKDPSKSNIMERNARGYVIGDTTIDPLYKLLKRYNNVNNKEWSNELNREILPKLRTISFPYFAFYCFDNFFQCY